MKKYSRETIWRTYDDRQLPIKDLEDNHILNLINQINQRINSLKKYLKELRESVNSDEYSLVAIKFEMNLEKYNLNLELLDVIHEEVKIRNLDISKVKNSKNLPFKNRDGEWMLWKEEVKRPTLIPNSIDFIKPLGDS